MEERIQKVYLADTRTGACCESNAPLWLRNGSCCESNAPLWFNAPKGR